MGFLGAFFAVLTYLVLATCAAWYFRVQLLYELLTALDMAIEMTTIERKP